MRVASLLSGGKDSLYATYIAFQYGWDVTHAVTVKPKKLSWMYHTENVHLADFVADSMGIPLIQKYSDAEKEVELDDLKSALQSI
ncbi:MAG: TIGR00289 family protein, partial [Nitrospiraceae bacterium]|nr:TIGR00289 family protein [Nitrospiraceae bacterium]